jgi:Domain of unknown function (DUF4192)
MTTIIKAADAAEFLALAPHLLGFTPSRSVVLVPFAGGRSLGGMRFDLPPEDADPVGFASTAMGLACRVSPVDAVLAIVYCDAAELAPPPRRELAAALETAAERCGLRLMDLLCVGTDAWTRYGPGPHPVAPLAGLPAPPPQALAENPPHPDHLAGAELPRTDLAARERVGRALQQVQRAIAVCCDGSAAGADDRIDPAAFVAACALDDLPALFEEALEEPPDDPYEQAALIWCLARPSLRDVGLTAWLDGLDAGDAALDAQLRWEGGHEYPASLAERMMGEGERPDGERLRTALEVTRRLAAVAPRDVRPGPLSVCAWIAWALGRSTHAERYAAWACEIDPEHGLSRIVLSMVQAGHLPDWAFRARRDGTT